MDPNAFIWDFTLTDAVRDLQISEANGGKNFTPTNIQSHLIAGDFFPGTQISPTFQIPQEIINYVNSVGDDKLQEFLQYLLDVAVNREVDPQITVAVQQAVSEIDPIQGVLSFLNSLAMAMDAWNIATFIPESDLIVGVTSELADKPKTDPSVSVFDDFVGHAIIRPVTKNIDVGNKVNFLLNSPINSSWFASISATSNRSAHHSSTVASIASLNNNPIVSYRDTTKIQLLAPNNFISGNVDSTLNIFIKISDTSNLLNCIVNFQNKMYYLDSIETGIIDLQVQINSNIIDTQKISVEGFYNYPDSGVFIYDDRSINIQNNDTLLEFGVTPDIMFLAKGEYRNPDYYAIYQNSGTNTVNFSQSIAINIADTSVVKFNLPTNSFMGNNDGETFAVITYEGFADTLYFVVGGCNQIIHPVIIPSGATLTATQGAFYFWSTEESTQSITPTTNGYYYVTVIDSGGCSGTSDSVYFGSVEITHNSSTGLNFILVPNPATDKVTVIAQLSKSGHYSIVLSSTMGQQLFTVQGESSGSVQQEINMNKFSPGIYFVLMRYGEKQCVRKLIIH